MSKERRASWKKKCAEYARFLRDDFDFDYTYILYLLRYKLGRTRRCLLRGHTKSAEQDAKDIQEVEDLLWKVCEHGYEEEVMATFTKKYGKPKMKATPVSEHADKIDLLYNGKPATKAMVNQMRKAWERAHANRVADLRKAFDIMAEKMWGWWD